MKVFIEGNPIDGVVSLDEIMVEGRLGGAFNVVGPRSQPSAVFVSKEAILLEYENGETEAFNMRYVVSYKFTSSRVEP